MNSKPLVVPTMILDATIASLKAAGRRDSEGVVLWLGRDAGASLVVTEGYVPRHHASNDYFHIPPEGMTELLARLGQSETMIVAQVHSHPRDAFHSRADDHWAIIRHEGALSFVLPRFAVETNRGNFADQVAGYRLSKKNRWLEIPHDDLLRVLQIR